MPLDFGKQAEKVFQNLTTCLDTAGAKVTDIVKLTFYIVDWETHQHVFGGPLMEFLTDKETGIGHRATLTLISPPALADPASLLEIEAVAAVPDTPMSFPTQVVAAPTITSVDLVVIGAGLSGLQAAVKIQESGLTCAILEARDRVGGKTCSRPLASGKGCVDIGAAWMNDTRQSKIYAISQKYGLELVVQPTEGSLVFQGMNGEIQRPSGEPGTEVYSNYIKAKLYVYADMHTGS